MISENGTLVEFYQGAVEIESKSAEAGRPIFEDRDFVRIQTPGDTRTRIDRIASAKDRERFPKAWAIYQRGEQVATEGTPLEEWPMVTRSQVMELKHAGIPSVEALVGVSDGNIQRLGPGYRQLREKARAYLESADAAAKATEWAREREAMQAQIAELKQSIEILQDAPKKRARKAEEIA